jgi:hypothetical protein
MQTIYTTTDHIMYRSIGRYQVRHGDNNAAYVVINKKRCEVSWFGLHTWFLV